MHSIEWRGATSHRDVPNDPGINERPAARTISVEAPMLQPSLGLDPDRFSLLKKPLRTTRAGDTIAFSYDTLNRLATKTPPSPAAVVSYRYDLAGRLTGISDTSAAIPAAVLPSGPPVPYATNFAYDALNRPTAVTWTPAPPAAAPTAGSVTFGHSYNKANQRSGQTVTDNSWFNYPAATPSTVSYTANALNQYTAVGAVSPTYNTNGNLTSDGTFAFGYDAENRLTSAVGAGNTASYTYDAQGRRKTKTVNGTTTVFVTDASNREVLEYDGASGAMLRWYAYGLGSNDVLNQMNVAAATRATFIPDIQGSVIASIDSGSGTLSKIGYLPYGKSAGATAPFGYTGQRIDPETSGLYYYRARHYSPAWGRFLQTDPIGAQGGVNLYAYVNNDPLNLVDPTGFVAEGFAAGFRNSLLGPNAAPLSSALQNGSLAFNAGAFLGIQAGAFVGMLPFLASDGALRIAPAAEEAGILANSARGAASEARVLQYLGLTRNTQSVVTAEGRSIPDALTDSLSVEIKDAANVSLTRQLRIQTDAARAAGRDSVLITGDRTCISANCSAAFDQIIRRPDLGPR